MRIRPLILLTGMILLGTGLGGCVGKPVAPVAPIGVPLESGSFVSLDLGGGEYPRVTIDFDPGTAGTSQVSGMAGCNRFTGGYIQTPTTLTFARLGATMMMCPDEQMKTERKFLGMMEGTLRYRLDSSGLLTLTTKDNQVMRFQAK